MKKYSLAVLGIVVAAAGIAYTMPKKSKAHHACDNLYWIKIASIQSNPCTNPVLVEPNDVDEDGLVTSADLGPAFITAASILTAESNGLIYGCQNQTTVCCAYGYRLNQLQVTDGKIVPIPGQTPICIFRDTIR